MNTETLRLVYSLLNLYDVLISVGFTCGFLQIVQIARERLVKDSFVI